MNQKWGREKGKLEVRRDKEAAAVRQMSVGENALFIERLHTSSNGLTLVSELMSTPLGLTPIQALTARASDFNDYRFKHL